MVLEHNFISSVLDVWHQFFCLENGEWYHKYDCCVILIHHMTKVSIV